MINGNMNFLKYSVNGKNVYEVTKETKYGTFKASVSPHQEDKEFETEWEGFDFAEYKCDIQVLKVKSQWYYQRYVEAKHIYTIMASKEQNDEDFKFMKDLKRQVYLAKRDYEKIHNQYLLLKNNYQKYTTNVIEKRKEIRSVVENRNRKLAESE